MKSKHHPPFISLTELKKRKLISINSDYFQGKTKAEKRNTRSTDSFLISSRPMLLSPAISNGTGRLRVERRDERGRREVERVESPSFIRKSQTLNRHFKQAERKVQSRLKNKREKIKIKEKKREKFSAG